MLYPFFSHFVIYLFKCAICWGCKVLDKYAVIGRFNWAYDENLGMTLSTTFRVQFFIQISDLTYETRAPSSCVRVTDC